jgi:hypothetical protein
MKTKFQVIYWRDIPVQVKCRSGETRIARALSPRFQEAIDRAAMLVDATSTDDYLATWHNSEWQEREGDASAVADTVTAELETTYSPDRLLLLEQNGGYEAPNSMGEPS